MDMAHSRFHMQRMMRQYVSSMHFRHGCRYLRLYLNQMVILDLSGILGRTGCLPPVSVVRTASHTRDSSARVTRHTERRCSMVRFLRRLLNIFRGSVRQTPMADNVASSEQIARYVLSKKHFSTSKCAVKYAAYLPAPNGETSVYRTSGLSEEEIWEIGQKRVAEPSGRSLHARGDTSASVILKTGLTIIPETTPHPLHANIMNWPSEKDKQKMLAIEIANEATLTGC